jgi:kynureninase
VKADLRKIALVLIPGIQYYTGQFLPIASICKAAHMVGAVCGVDLAHAVGNVPLSLSEWNVDFAVWCTYKCVNSLMTLVMGFTDLSDI